MARLGRAAPLFGAGAWGSAAPLRGGCGDPPRKHFPLFGAGCAGRGYFSVTTVTPRPPSAFSP